MEFVLALDFLDEGPDSSWEQALVFEADVVVGLVHGLLSLGSPQDGTQLCRWLLLQFLL